MPKMIMNKFDDYHFGSIIDDIFSLNDRNKSKELIKSYSSLWTQMQSGSQGISGKKTINAMTMFNKLFDEVDSTDSNIDSDEIDTDSLILEVLE